MTVLNTQFGVGDETVYGTGVVPNRFFETNGVPDLAPEYGRSQSEGLRTGTRVARSDRFVPYNMGGGGTAEMDVPTIGWSWWLKHLLGTVTTGATVDSNTTHVGDVGSLTGDSFTAQVGRAFHPSGTVQAFTYEGGKVTSWELSNDVEGLLVASIDCDFEDVTTATSLATASYAAGAAVFAWTGATVTIGGASMELSNFTVSVDNNLKTDRRYLRGSALKKEPVESGMRSIEWSADMDFVDLTQYNRFVSATAAGASAAIVATWSGPVVHAGATLPYLQVSIPVARFDAVDLSTGAEPMTQSVSGVGLFDGSSGPISITYRSSNAVA